MIFAGSSDKDLAGMVQVLAPHFAQAYVTRFASNRSVPPEELLEVWRRNASQPATPFADPVQAWQAARAAAKPADLICVTGSVFLAGELRPVILAAGGGKSEPEPPQCPSRAAPVPASPRCRG